MAIQIIEENRRPGGRERFAQSLGNFGKAAGAAIAGNYAGEKQREMQAKEDKKLSEILGQDVSGLSPEMKKVAFQQIMTGQQQGQKQQQKENYLNQLFGPRGNQPMQGMQRGQGLQGDQEMGQNPQEMNQQGFGGFDVTKLTDEDIARASAVDPNMGRALSHAKDVALREKREQRNFEALQEQRSPEKIREKQLTHAQSTADVNYNKDLQAAHKQHEIKTQTLDRLEELNKKGVSGKPYEKLLEKFGLINLTSEGRREFAADVKNLITDIKAILGGQFSQYEFQTILNAYPSADFSQGANEAIIRNLKDFQDIRNQEFKIAKNLKSENGGKIPEDFQSKVNDRLQEYAQSKIPQIKANSQEIMREQLGLPVGFTVLIAPDGEQLGVPNDEVDRLIELGAQMP